MHVELERPTRRPPGVASREPIPDGLDWGSFSAAYFPGRRRHDLEALIAYAAYRSARETVAGPSDGAARIETGRGATALRNWEDEGGATR